MEKEETKSEKNTQVVRISKQAYAKIKKIKGKTTFVDFIDSSVDTLESLAQQDPIYIVGEQVYANLKEARGQAIQDAARANLSDWELPLIAVILGKDNGN